ncbi:hypothetical protein AXX17_AT3G03860 [Arabidopsis thaliana]|uniref:Uncharacterized protein n=1 Tax=Arabidopsis thaliana TaxID=3702 RepID=A0A178VL36_ARATH|nr:hypothetical protein AXX17_AT3G03860 [Arabidopsis thaliana]
MLTSPSNALHSSTPHFWPVRRSRLCRSRNFPRFHSGERSSGGGGKLCSLSLLSGSGAGKFSVRALVRPNDTNDADSVGDGFLSKFHSEIESREAKLAALDILVETDLMGRQASSAVTVTDGETIVYTSVFV